MSLWKYNPRRIEVSREKFSWILNSHSCKCSNGFRLTETNKDIILPLNYSLYNLHANHHNRKKNIIMRNDCNQFCSTSGSDIRIACKWNDQTDRNCDSYEQTKEKPHFSPISRRIEPWTSVLFEILCENRTESALLLRLMSNIDNKVKEEITSRLVIL